MKNKYFYACLLLLFANFTAFSQNTGIDSVTIGNPMNAAIKDALKTPSLDDLLAQDDWANLSRFRKENEALAPALPGEIRVVFMGNSITQGWGEVDPGFFAGKPYVNRGISGQTTPQMLIRFRPDVIALKPKVVVILAGTNDIAGNTGYSTLEMIEDNLASMADLATANNIRVVLSSVLPAYDYPWKPGLQPAPKIAALNQWIKNYCKSKGFVYLDYYSPMVDARQGLKSEFSEDGVHPNLAGYKLMAPLAEKAIQEALKK
jgi:lysophospholipase L1-like esterase